MQMRDEVLIKAFTCGGGGGLNHETPLKGCKYFLGVGVGVKLKKSRTACSLYPAVRI